jgi:hypothetical protein
VVIFLIVRQFIKNAIVSLKMDDSDTAFFQLAAVIPPNRIKLMPMTMKSILPSFAPRADGRENPLEDWQ